MGSLLQDLKDEGVDVRPEDNWEGRGSRDFTPVGVMVHHTAGRGEAGRRIIRDGRAGLRGPLAAVHPRKDGSVHLVAAGRANHAGRGMGSVLELVKKDQPPPSDAPFKGDTNGNKWFYGIEMENLGTGKDPWPDVQLDAAVRCAAALCRRHGWTAARVIGHREWTRRKAGDPRLPFSMDDFRHKVAQQLGQAPSTTCTHLPKDLIDRAAALGLFVGDPTYYYPHPDGAATSDERDHLLTVIVDTAVGRLEMAQG